MNYAIFNAVSPFEIGDKIIDQNSRRVYEITDIMCVHRLRAGTVSFKYELNHSGRFVELEPAERTKERAVRSEKIENARAARSAEGDENDRKNAAAEEAREIMEIIYTYPITTDDVKRLAQFCEQTAMHGVCLTAFLHSALEAKRAKKF